MGELELLFLGTGTSAGIPMIGCRCDVCRSPDPRDKRTRASAVLSYASTRVLIDTTPELRLQCVLNEVERIDAIVYTHAHADHIMGLDDVRRFNALRGGPLDVYADDRTRAILDQCFGYAFREPPPDLRVFRPHLEPRRIDGPFAIGAARWTPIPLLHGDMPILGFRVGDVAYCTDVSGIPDASMPLLEGLDVLVLDALQHRPHVSHFTLAQAIEQASRIAARRTFFTHMAHALGHEATCRDLPSGMTLAHDGLRVVSPLTEPAA